MRNGITQSLERATRSKERYVEMDAKEIERYMETARTYFLGIGIGPDMDAIEGYVTERVADEMGVLPFNLPFHVRQTIKRVVRGES